MLHTCSCKGYNENCYRCFGSGFCEEDINATSALVNDFTYFRGVKVNRNKNIKGNKNKNIKTNFEGKVSSSIQKTEKSEKTVTSREKARIQHEAMNVRNNIDESDKKKTIVKDIKDLSLLASNFPPGKKKSVFDPSLKQWTDKQPKNKNSQGRKVAKNKGDKKTASARTASNDCKLFCPYCSKPVTRQSFIKHLEMVHLPYLRRKGLKPHHVSPLSDRPVIGPLVSGDPSWKEATNYRERIDATKGFHNYREGGRFGSHSSYDPMDDDSFA